MLSSPALLGRIKRPQVSYPGSGASHSNVAGTSFSYASVPYGAVARDRMLVAAIFALDYGGGLDTTNPFSNVLISGERAVRVSAYTGPALNISLYQLVKPGETSGTVSFSTNATVETAGVAVFRVVDWNHQLPCSAIVGNSTGDPLTHNIFVPPGGVAIGMASAAVLGDITWTNLTESFDTAVTDGLGDWNISGAILNPTLTGARPDSHFRAVSADTSAVVGMALASWR